MKAAFYFVPAFFLFQSCFAQQDSAEKNNVPGLHADLAYSSNSVYLGRKDSLKLPYLTPGVRYTSSCGFYAAASASLLTTESRLDAVSLDAGYDVSKENFYGGLAASAYIFNPQSVNVRAEASTSLSAYAGYSLPFVQPGVSASLVFGSSTVDCLTGFSLEHSFATHRDVFSFTPAFYLNAGTQQFYNEYYQERKYNSGSGKGRSRNKTGSNNGSGNSSTVVSARASQTSRFSVLDCEFAGTFVYQLNGFSFSFVPRYAIPQSSGKVVITTKGPGGVLSTQTFTENIGNSFYWSLGVSYHLDLKKHG